MADAKVPPRQGRLVLACGRVPVQNANRRATGVPAFPTPQSFSSSGRRRWLLFFFMGAFGQSAGAGAASGVTKCGCACTLGDPIIAGYQAHEAEAGLSGTRRRLVCESSSARVYTSSQEGRPCVSLPRPPPPGTPSLRRSGERKMLFARRGADCRNPDGRPRCVPAQEEGSSASATRDRRKATAVAAGNTRRPTCMDQGRSHRTRGGWRLGAGSGGAHKAAGVGCRVGAVRERGFRSRRKELS